VVQELVPFLGGECAVFFGRSQRPASGDETSVVRDDVLGIDRGISHRGSDIDVAEDLGGDVRRQSGAKGIGSEEPPEVMGRIG
jgi:hypothetical protein